MASKIRIPEIDRNNPALEQVRRSFTALADQRCENPSDFWARSKAARAVMADLLWMDEQERLEAAATDAPEVHVEGETYRQLSCQPSSMVLHGLWGAHRVSEPLYRLVGVHNGPTMKPLLRKVGIVQGSLLPDLADEAGEVLTGETSREAELLLQRLGFRPPSRATLQKRIGGLHADMEVSAADLEEQIRPAETLDFKLGSVSCGLDRFAVRMDEDLADGPERDAKLATRQQRNYQRTPPEPYESQFRMAWAGNVTMYDEDGVPQKSVRYGTDAEDSSEVLVSRMVADVLHLVQDRTDVPVAIVQDGARDLDVLPKALKERLPEGVPRRQMVDFAHAIAYLDTLIQARGDGDPFGMAAVYSSWLLDTDDGVERVLRHLRREAKKDALTPEVKRAIGAAYG